MTEHVHIDIMDGIFVQTKSIAPLDLIKYKFTAETVAHLMVVDPLSWLPVLCKCKIKQVIIHAEITNFNLCFKKFTNAGFRVGIGLLNSTDFTVIPHIGRYKWLHLMNGLSGSYGSSVSKNSISRVKKIKKISPNSFISCDIGLRPSNIPSFISAGIDEIVVGSYIWRGSNPLNQWKKLLLQQHKICYNKSSC